MRIGFMECANAPMRRQLHQCTDFRASVNEFNEVKSLNLLAFHRCFREFHCQWVAGSLMLLTAHESVSGVHSILALPSFFRFFVLVVRLPLRYVAFRHFLFLAMTLLLPSTLPASAQQLKVMQWNVHGNVGTTTAQSSAGAAAIARVLNYLQPD